MSCNEIQFQMWPYLSQIPAEIYLNISSIPMYETFTILQKTFQGQDDLVTSNPVLVRPRFSDHLREGRPLLVWSAAMTLSSRSADR